MPGVVTLDSVARPNAFALTNGMTITFSHVQGMYQLNDNRYMVTALDTNAKTFQLRTIEFLPVDTSLFSPYIAGGEINIISYPATAGNPPGLMYNNQ